MAVIGPDLVLRNPACRMNAWLYCRNAAAYAAGNCRKWERPGFRADAMAELQRLQAGSQN